ncbi:MAG: ADP-ribosylation factor-like protein [Promethearchaeota archaeon]|jgi:Ras-related protein Rab-7A
MPKKFILKILTAGDGGVGKTTLLHRYVEGRFSADTKMTIGVEFFLKETEIDSKQCTLQLWDFGGLLRVTY